jgi:hypothetical protein
MGSPPVAITRLMAVRFARSCSSVVRRSDEPECTPGRNASAAELAARIAID